MSADVLAIIQRITLLSVLSDAERSLVAASGRICRFSPGQEIVKQGEKGTTFYVVGSGQLEVWMTPPQGARLTDMDQVVQPIVLEQLGPGTFFGEMSLLTGARRNASIKALTPAILVELDRPIFMRLFQGNPGLVRQITDEIAARNANRHLKADHHPSLAATTAESRGPAGTSERDHAAKDDLFSRIKSVFGLS
jgi:CRP-like cAMP-binding protein